MLIRRLILENYGLFAGRNEVDLVPRTENGKRRTIVLFGGKNGAGKTTILEAIRVVLYGRLSLGSRVRAVDYDTFLRNRIHRSEQQTFASTSASLAIEFDHVHLGVVGRFLVERSWRTTGVNIAEQLSVLRDGQRLEEIDAEFWQGFVRDIIPEGLSQLFFFDGEKIKELAEDATSAGVLADSIKSLLGLDLVERLDADLTVYANREVARIGSDGDRHQWATLEAELKSFQDAITKCEEELATNRSQQDGAEASLRRAEEDLRRQGEGLANRRSQLQSDRIRLTESISEIEKALRDECDGLFPLALCPSLADRLLGELKKERLSAHSIQVRSALETTRTEVLKAVTGAATRVAIDKIFSKRLTAVADAASSSTGHQLSDIDESRIRVLLGAARSQSQIAVGKKCEELAKCRQKLEAAERSLAQIPADASVRPQIEALSDLNRRLGVLQQSRHDLEERLRGLRFQCEAKGRQLKSLASNSSGSRDAGNRIQLAKSVQEALNVYLERLTELKINQLRNTVAHCFNRLCRKSDVVTRIDIDVRTFAVTLFDSHQRPLAKEELSSGEKQIFAIAMLWGLAQTSGRPLPVIIDTPLGRLDSDHRRNLIDQYFPHASHQVILLSTDTEVDQKLFDELRPNVSHAFCLSYHDREMKTTITDGYFWRNPTNA